MSYIMGQIVVAGGSTVPLFRVPSGLCNVSFWNNTPSATIYVGTSTAVTSANGLVCHSIPTSFFNYVSSGGVQFYGTVASGPGTISYIIVTDQLRSVMDIKFCPKCQENKNVSAFKGICPHQEMGNLEALLDFISYEGVR